MTAELGFVDPHEILAVRESVVDQFNRLKAAADEFKKRPYTPVGAWSAFCAGTVAVSIRHFDNQLAKFGVEVNDGET